MIHKSIRMVDGADSFRLIFTASPLHNFLQHHAVLFEEFECQTLLCIMSYSSLRCRLVFDKFKDSIEMIGGFRYSSTAMAIEYLGTLGPVQQIVLWQWTGA